MTAEFVPYGCRTIPQCFGGSDRRHLLDGDSMNQHWHDCALAEWHLPWRSVEDHSDGAVSRLCADGRFVARSSISESIRHVIGGITKCTHPHKRMALNLHAAEANCAPLHLHGSIVKTIEGACLI